MRRYGLPRTSALSISERSACSHTVQGLPVRGALLIFSPYPSRQVLAGRGNLPFFPTPLRLARRSLRAGTDQTTRQSPVCFHPSPKRLSVFLSPAVQLRRRGPLPAECGVSLSLVEMRYLMGNGHHHFIERYICPNPRLAPKHEPERYALQTYPVRSAARPLQLQPLEFFGLVLFTEPGELRALQSKRSGGPDQGRAGTGSELRRHLPLRHLDQIPLRDRTHAPAPRAADRPPAACPSPRQRSRPATGAHIRSSLRRPA